MFLDGNLPLSPHGYQGRLPGLWESSLTSAVTLSVQRSTLGFPDVQVAHLDGLVRTHTTLLKAYFPCCKSIMPLLVIVHEFETLRPVGPVKAHPGVDCCSWPVTTTGL